jgi:hypothetical protein
MDKIQRPAGIRPSLEQDWRPGTHRPAAGPALADAEAFFPVEPVDSAYSGRFAMLAQQDEQPAIAKAPASIRKLAQLDAQFGIRRPARPIADHLAVGADDRAGPPL